MRVLIGADATRAIETSSDEFRTLVLGAIFSDVVSGSAYADNLDLLEDAIEDPRNENIKGFSQKEMVKEMKRVVKDVGKQPIGKLLRGQELYKKFDIGEGDEFEKPFDELTLDEILDDEKIKRLLGFRQMQRPPEIEAGTNGFITSSYLNKAITNKRGFVHQYKNLTPGQNFTLEISESSTADIDGSKVDYLQKEGYSPYLTTVKPSKIMIYDVSKKRGKETSLYSQAVKNLEEYKPSKGEKEEFKQSDVKKFLEISLAKEGEELDEYLNRIKGKITNKFFNYLLVNNIKGKTLMEIFYEEKLNTDAEFEGMPILDIVNNPDKFIQKVFPTDWNLFDMKFEIDVKKENIRVKLEGLKTHGLFETGLVYGKGTDSDSSSYTAIGRTVPLGTQRKGSDYRRKLRDFAAVIRNNYLELMEV